MLSVTRVPFQWKWWNAIGKGGMERDWDFWCLNTLMQLLAFKLWVWCFCSYIYNSKKKICLSYKYFKSAVHLRPFYNLWSIKISLWNSILAECNFQNRPARSYLFINLDILELETLETSQMLRLLNFAKQNPFDPWTSALIFLSVNQRESTFIQTEGWPLNGSFLSASCGKPGLQYRELLLTGNCWTGMLKSIWVTLFWHF